MSAAVPFFDAARGYKREIVDDPLAVLTPADVDAINAATRDRWEKLRPAAEFGPHASDECIEKIKGFEGCVLKAYLCPARVWTIGYGATGAGIYSGVTWTIEQANRRLLSDVRACEVGVRQLIGDAPTTQGQFDALVSFAFNCGLDIDNDHTPEGLGDSTLLKLHLQRRYDEAAREFGKWVNGGGKKLQGLVNRRREEEKLYRSGS